MSTVREIIEGWAASLTEEQRAELSSVQTDGLEAALLAREDNMADILRLAGAQFGMYPFIVAEVLRQVGIGTPLSEEEQQMIHEAYVNGMNALIEEQRRAQEGGDSN